MIGRAIGTAAALSVAILAMSPSPAHALRIIYTNDVLGELEPCGCRENPTGGMARKSNLIARLGDDQLLMVDAGDLFFESADPPLILRDQARVQARYVVDAMNLLRHDVVVPGEKDFALGLEFFEELRDRAKFDFLAANLLKKNGKPLLKARKIYERKTADGQRLRIGVFGLVGDQITWPEGLSAGPALAAAREQVEELKDDGADLVVAVTHQGYDRDVELGESVEGIDVVIGAHTQSFLQNPVMAGKSVVYQTAFRNQHVGVLPVSKPFKGEGHEVVALDAGYDTPGPVKTEMDELIDKYKAAIAEFNTQRDAELTHEEAPKGPASYQTFPRCAECHVTQFDFWRKTPHMQALTPLLKVKQIRNKDCLRCHTVGLGTTGGFDDVLKMAERDLPPPPKGKKAAQGAAGEPKTGHLTPEDLADYLQRLHDVKSLDAKLKIHHSDPEPLPARLSFSMLRRSWAPVQCENCHAPGGDHPFSGSYSKTVAKELCLGCHTPDRAPKWYDGSGKPDWKLIEAKRASIACPAGD